MIKRLFTIAILCIIINSNFIVIPTLGLRINKNYEISIPVVDKRTECWALCNMSHKIIENFETDLSQWQIGTDLPEDPNNHGNPVFANVSVNSSIAHTGSQSVKFEIDGSADDGTIWLYKNISVKNGIYLVRLSVYVKDTISLGNHRKYLPLFIGVKYPQKETDFHRKLLDLYNGWRKITYRNIIRVKENKIIIAFGLSVVYEVYVKCHMDDLIIKYTKIF
jgi:hypothetical protein